MLIEWLKYLLSGGDKTARRLGYLSEAIAIESRYKRVKESWTPHIENTHAAIIDAAEHCQSKRRVIVLGAGSMIDVPIAYLSDKFTQVDVVDRVFTLGARNKIRPFDNITAHTRDVSGIRHGLENWDCHSSLPAITYATIDMETSELDLVVSANLLSQLAVVPRAYLEKRCHYTEHDLDAWCQRLIAQHIALLRSFKSNICLISDVCHTLYDTDSHDPVAIEDRLYGYEIGHTDASWTWDLAPTGELKRGYALKARVESHFWQRPKEMPG